MSKKKNKLRRYLSLQNINNEIKNDKECFMALYEEQGNINTFVTGDKKRAVPAIAYLCKAVMDSNKIDRKNFMYILNKTFNVIEGEKENE